MLSDNKNYIGVCMGIACCAKGAEEVHNEISNYIDEMSVSNLFTVQSIRCPGECHNAPIVILNGKILAKQSIKSIRKVLSEIIDS